MNAILISVCGFAGSGKDTVGKILTEEFGYTKDSFAAPLKDCCATIFGWNREMLEGITPESRVWREEIDTWWAEKLDIPNFSPRFALQYIGTEVLRRNFNDSIWLLSLENRFLKNNRLTVVTDCRFQNELNLVRRLGGYIIQVNRGPKPDWWDFAAEANSLGYVEQITYLEEVLGIHASEYSWIGSSVDYIIDNNTTIEDLYIKTREISQKISCK